MLDAFLVNRFVPVVSAALLDEIRDVLDRPRIRRRWQMSGADIATVLALLQDRSSKATPTGNLHLCRDPDDDILLETALVGGARYFVSRDDDVKRDQELIARLKEWGVEILSVARFLALLETPG